jgi:hypothetical protein
MCVGGVLVANLYSIPPHHKWVGAYNDSLTEFMRQHRKHHYERGQR